jgi:hypothetical protein
MDSGFKTFSIVILSLFLLMIMLVVECYARENDEFDNKVLKAWKKVKTLSRFNFILLITAPVYWSIVFVISQFYVIYRDLIYRPFKWLFKLTEK